VKISDQQSLYFLEQKSSEFFSESEGGTEFELETEEFSDAVFSSSERKAEMPS